MKLRSILWLTVSLLAVAVSGCRKSAASVGSENAKVFASADAQTKANWEAAMSAFQTNDFATSIVVLGRLSNQTNLTSEQLDAVKQTAAAISDQMWTAANKGDANALRAIAELRKVQQR